MTMQRDIEQDFDQWKSQQSPQPLAVFGPQQVGKTTTIQYWAKSQFFHCIYLNFDTHPDYKLCFQQLDPKIICQKIENLFHCHLNSPKTILVCDGMDSFFRGMIGIKLIKECYPHLHIILTGKYRYFGHPQKYFENIDTCYMGPMTFIEVLKNTRHAYLVDELEQFDYHHPLSKETHDSCLSLVQDYIETGGLPHIIAKINHLSSFKSSDETPDNPFSQPHSIDSKFDHFYENYEKPNRKALHHDYLQCIQVDIKKKVRPSKNACLQGLLQLIHPFIGHPVKYSRLGKGQTAQAIRDAIKDLSDLYVIQSVTGSTADSFDLFASSKASKIKLYYADLSLLNAFLYGDYFDHSDTQLNQEQVAKQYEHFVIQECHTLWGHRHERGLFYWFRDKKSSGAQLDLLWPHHDQIIPIDVMTEPVSYLPSMALFFREKGQNVGITVSHQNLSFDKQRLNVPFYALSQLPRLVQSLGKSIESPIQKDAVLELS